MKATKTSLAALALTGLLAFGASAYAQNTNAPGGPRQGGRAAMTTEAQMKQLTERLQLTDDQKTKVKAIIEEQTKKERELRGDSAQSREDRHTKMQAVREETTKKMKEVLTAEQFKKYEEFLKEQRNRRGGPGGPGGPGAGAPEDKPAKSNP